MDATSAGKARRRGALGSYLELCRASNLPTVWTNVLAAVVLGGAAVFSTGAGLARLVAIAASLSLTYLAGMALNDVLDVDEDRVKKPARPIPSGRISRAGAALFAVALFCAGLALLAIAGTRSSLAAGAALIVVIALYDGLHARSWLTVLLMASCRALVFVVAALALAGPLPPLVLIAAAAQFAYIVGLTAVARWEKAKPRSLRVPPIPWLLAGISLVDGALMAIFVAPAWLAAGACGALLTRLFQTRVRGD